MPFDHYIRNNMIFDTARFAGGIAAVKAANSAKSRADRIVFCTDYPQEIRSREIVRCDFVGNIRALGTDGEKIRPGMRGSC